VYHAAVQLAPEGQPTAQIVQAVVDQRHFRVQCSGEQEWYTPKRYIDAARQVLGAIDLDPATSFQAQARIQATDFYTTMDRALMQDWHGRVWLNPPYSSTLITQFTDKLLHELEAGRVEQAILLTHNYTETTWSQTVAAQATLICWPKGRIKFERADGYCEGPPNGQIFWYFGSAPHRFVQVFSAFGVIMRPV
jgi:DNA N-6-adenine-methyltransferase (Dam)